MNSVKLYNELVSRCENRLLNELKVKVNDFVQLLEDEEWNPKQPNEFPNPYMENFVQWISATIMSLDVHYMNNHLVHNAASQTIKHFQSGIIEIITSKVQKFNIAAIYNLEIDLRYLEDNFTNSELKNKYP